jgi:hypothetical protein
MKETVMMEFDARVRLARRRLATRALWLSLSAWSCAAFADTPAEIAAKDEQVLFQVHAFGVQVYECKADEGGKMSWRFREPLAALSRDNKNVGKHYAGPTWEIDGSAIVGKAIANAPGEAPNDIPWLKLEVVDRHGDGPLKDVTAIQRINTQGGSFSGTCDKPGALHGEIYSADYVFLKKTP